MFFPEELITYAVYSNPADFCQGKKTPERWLRLVLFRKGGWFDRHTGGVVRPGLDRLKARDPGWMCVGCCVSKIDVTERKTKLMAPLTSKGGFLPCKLKAFTKGLCA